MNISPTQGDTVGQKRKRTPSTDSPGNPSPSKAARTPARLEINYLARQYTQDIPLASPDDPLPALVAVLNEYAGVLERHESLARNLGARSLGPVLVQRFERLFDGPPRVVKAHGKHSASGVTWLDVVEFARAKPDQFVLGPAVGGDGPPVCDIYLKHCRVHISEEDYMLIKSGMPQRLIPPQPIAEDEEKELGTIQILEENLAQVVSLADQVAARGRQLNHRMRSRKKAIIDRRASQTSASGGDAVRASSPSNVALVNGGSSAAPLSPSGFTAMNNRSASDVAMHTDDSFDPPPPPSTPGTVSRETRDELLSQFTATASRRASVAAANGAFSSAPRASLSNPTIPSDSSPGPSPAHNPVAIPNTPASLLPRSRPPQAERDDGGPFKPEMVSRLESLTKGDLIAPPCDRCRRLHIPCLKNLTACAGCTKKHAKCSWKEVSAEELSSSGGPPPDGGVAADDMDNTAASVVRQADAEEEQEEQHRRAAHSLALAAMDRSVASSVDAAASEPQESHQQQQPLQQQGHDSRGSADPGKAESVAGPERADVVMMHQQ